MPLDRTKTRLVAGAPLRRAACAALLALAVASCAPPRGASPCNDTVDCRRGEACIDGRCREAPASVDAGLGPAPDGGLFADGGAPDGGAPDDGAPDGGADAGEAVVDAGLLDGGDDVDGGLLDGGGVVDGGDDVDGGAPSDGGAFDGGAACPPVAADALCAVPDAGLVLCFDFERAGPDFFGNIPVPDESGAGHDGSATGAALVAGVDGQGMSFAPGGALFVEHTEAIGGAGPFTIEAWLRCDALPATGRQAIMDATDRFGLFLVAPGVLECRIAASDGSILTLRGRPVVEGAWTHAACMLAPLPTGAALATLYQGGVRVAEADHAGGLGASGEDLVFGADGPFGGQSLQGVLDRVRLFRAARSDDDVCRSASPP